MDALHLPPGIGPDDVDSILASRFTILRNTWASGRSMMARSGTLSSDEIPNSNGNGTPAEAGDCEKEDQHNASEGIMPMNLRTPPLRGVRHARLGRACRASMRVPATINAAPSTVTASGNSPKKSAPHTVAKTICR